MHFLALLLCLTISTSIMADEPSPLCVVYDKSAKETQGYVSAFVESQQISLTRPDSSNTIISCQNITKILCQRTRGQSFKRIGAWGLVGGAVGFFLLPALGPIAPLTAAGLSTLGAGGGSWLSGSGKIDRLEDYCS